MFHLPAPLPLGRPRSQCYERGLCTWWYKVLVNLKCPWEWTCGLSWPQMPLRVQWGRSGHSLGNAKICSGFQGCPGPGFQKLQPWHLQPSGSVCPGQARSWTRVPQGRSCPPPRRAGSGCAPSSSQARPEEALHPAGPPFLPQENLWSDTASLPPLVLKTTPALGPPGEEGAEPLAGCGSWGRDLVLHRGSCVVTAAGLGAERQRRSSRWDPSPRRGGPFLKPSAAPQPGLFL